MSRTITLTGRAPVSINESDWPIIAEATDKEFDNQYEFQANYISKWSIRVRKHADGRAIVYATYSHTSNYQNSRDYSVKHGVLLPAQSDNDAICQAIQEVASRMESAESYGEDANRWSQFADDCIADMPAEELK